MKLAPQLHIVYTLEIKVKIKITNFSIDNFVSKSETKYKKNNLTEVTIKNKNYFKLSNKYADDLRKETNE